MQKQRFKLVLPEIWVGVFVVLSFVLQMLIVYPEEEEEEEVGWMLISLNLCVWTTEV